MHGNGMGMGIWGFVFTSVTSVLLLALIIVAIIALVRYTTRGDGRLVSGDSARGPEQVLAERYARGEIDEDEYRRRMQVLRER